MVARDPRRFIERTLTVGVVILLLMCLGLAFGAQGGAETPEKAIPVNAATAEQFAQVFGVSLETGGKLTAYRNRMGGFQSADQLLGAKALDPAQARPYLRRFIARDGGQVARGFWLGTALLLGASLLIPAWLRARAGGGDPFLLPLTFLLSGFGVALLFSIKDPLRDYAVYLHHIQGIALGLLVLVALARLAPEARRRLRNYQYVWALLAFLLIGALALFGSGPEGVKLSLFFFQPVEIIKLLLALFAACYLADRADLIADSSTRFAPSKSEPVTRGGKPDLSLALPRPQDLGPLVVMFVVALAMFFIIKDLGPGLLLFATFVSLLTLATGRGGFLVIGGLLMLIGAFLIYRLDLGVSATRVEMWLSPFANSRPTGMQLGQAYWALASGGVEGSGLGLGMPGLVPRSGSDLAFIAWAEETGLAGAWLVLTAFVALVWRGLKIAVSASNDFDRALAFGLTALLGLQSLLILGGVTGLFPLTGISLPFLAYGNSALVADFAIIGLLYGISTSVPKGGVGARDAVRTAARRFAVGFAVITLGGIGIGRLGWIQAVKANEIAARPIRTPDADKVVRPHANPRLLAVARSIPRGSIYDRNGEVLATSRLDEIQRYVPNEKKAQRLLAARGRFYPFGPATAHLVGFLDPAVGGPSGFEKGYDGLLRGYESLEELLRDYRSKDLPWPIRPKRVGEDIHLTLDAKLQQVALNALREGVKNLKDRQGRPKNRAAFVLMEPETGDVLAAASLPTFDPNALTPQIMQSFAAGPQAEHEKRLINRAAYGVYPPGSTLKVATAATALDNGFGDFRASANRIEPRIAWKANGVHYMRRNTRDDRGDPAFGVIGIETGFRVSSNIYFAKLAVAMGPELFRQALAEKMRFRAVPPQKQFDADLPDLGYGQGRMLASPLEMARLAAAVANDGAMRKARFLSKITQPRSDEPDPAVEPVTLGQAMTAETAARVRDLMRSVVTGGTARGLFDGIGVPVAGKTGTAENELYDKLPHSWFIGFAPYGEGRPRVAFACVVENGGYGRRVAGVICRDVLRQAF